MEAPFAAWSLAAAPELTEEPGLGQAPLALDGPGGDREDLGRLLDAQPAEEAQLDDPALAGIERGQAVERVVERDEVGGALDRDAGCLSERHLRHPAPALEVVSAARVIDQ